MSEGPPRYQTLLLTFWEERSQNSNTPSVWRYRLEDPRTGCKQGFASLGALVVALEQMMTDDDDNDRLNRKADDRE